MTAAVPFGFSGLWTVIHVSALSVVPSPTGAALYHPDA